MIKPWIAQFQTEGVFPSQSITHSIGCLTICQVLHELQYSDQRQAPGCFSRLSSRRKEISEQIIRVNSAQRITELHDIIATGVGDASIPGRLFSVLRHRSDL